MEKQEICLLNDAFPPLIDGVSNAVVNYAGNLPGNGYSVVVAVPKYPGADDSGFDFPVVRYPSIDLRKKIGYTAGRPFVPRTLRTLGKRNITLLHSHCPISSTYLGRGLREQLDVPLVLTYHTKFDVDIANAVKGKLLCLGAVKALVENVSAADELWVVSRGAGENIRSLGYAGEYTVMPNGVDIPRHRAAPAEIAAVTAGYDLPADVPVFLFVGRLMWYKGLGIILEALAALRSQNVDFRMVFIGGGGDEAEVRARVSALRLEGKCFFTGPVYDRTALAAWYSRADLFLFPSAFDTNGLVVREAAACSLGAVVIGDSCAAEGVTDRVNGLFIEENAASLAVCLARVMQNRDLLRRLGENASRDLYLSWEEAVSRAAARYGEITEAYRAGRYKKHRGLTDEVFVLQSDLMEAFDRMEKHKRKLDDRIGRYL